MKPGGTKQLYEVGPTSLPGRRDGNPVTFVAVPSISGCAVARWEADAPDALMGRASHDPGENLGTGRNGALPIQA